MPINSAPIFVCFFYSSTVVITNITSLSCDCLCLAEGEKSVNVNVTIVKVNVTIFWTFHSTSYFIQFFTEQSN